MRRAAVAPKGTLSAASPCSSVKVDASNVADTERSHGTADEDAIVSVPHSRVAVGLKREVSDPPDEDEVAGRRRLHRKRRELLVEVLDAIDAQSGDVLTTQGADRFGRLSKGLVTSPRSDDDLFRTDYLALGGDLSVGRSARGTHAENDDREGGPPYARCRIR